MESSVVRRLASLLSRYPGLKRGTKFCYQSANFLLHFHTAQKRSRFRVDRISRAGGGFFGYYDKSPESNDGRNVLYHVPVLGFRKGFPVGIAVHNRDSNAVRLVGETGAWNPQIGARLQWISTDTFVFNTYDPLSDSYRAIIASADGIVKNTLENAVYEVSENTYAGLDFKNLAGNGSEYGYFAHVHNSTVPPAVIYAGDLGSGGRRDLVLEEQMRDLVPDAFRNGWNLHFNHLLFNPGGTSLVFLIRWTGSSGRRDALCLYDMEQGSIRVLNEGMNSHFCWTSPHVLFGFLEINSVRGFYYLDVRTGKPTLVPAAGIYGDGHPSCRQEVVLFDTYPDSDRMQHLLLLHGERLLHAGSFRAPLVYNEYYRCDLHPRFSPDGERIYFDSMHEGQRNLYCLYLKEDHGA